MSPITMPCPQCNGAGASAGLDCKDCDGVGFLNIKPEAVRMVTQGRTPSAAKPAKI